MQFWQRLGPAALSLTVENEARSALVRPMNGQRERMKLVREIVTECRIGRVIETGAFIGNTTAWLAGFGLPVMTVRD